MVKSLITLVHSGKLNTAVIYCDVDAATVVNYRGIFKKLAPEVKVLILILFFLRYLRSGQIS
jgi:hypothetical protein